MEDCIFCRIARHDIPSQIVHEDDDVVAFKDVNPTAPVHVLIVPKRHIPGVDALAESDSDLVGRIMLVAQSLAREFGLAADGYRVVVNQGKSAGQSVGHLHFHLLGGRHLGWPPG